VVHLRIYPYRGALMGKLREWLNTPVSKVFDKKKFKKSFGKLETYDTGIDWGKVISFGLKIFVILLPITVLIIIVQGAYLAITPVNVSISNDVPIKTINNLSTWMVIVLSIFIPIAIYRIIRKMNVG
jgi:hypothetical protein